MNHSESITNIAKSLLVAQKQITSVMKESSNPFFKSRYADLLSVILACKEELNGAGILVLQPIMGDKVETTLIDEKSGEWLSSETMIVCAKQNDPQAYGSAITYARRYGLQSMVLLPSEDDDGEGAMNRKPTTSAGKMEAEVDYAIKNLKGFVKAMEETENDEVEVERLLRLADLVTHSVKASEQQKKWVNEVADKMCERLGIGLDRYGK